MSRIVITAPVTPEPVTEPELEPELVIELEPAPKPEPASAVPPPPAGVLPGGLPLPPPPESEPSPYAPPPPPPELQAFLEKSMPAFESEVLPELIPITEELAPPEIQLKVNTSQNTVDNENGE